MQWNGQHFPKTSFRNKLNFSLLNWYNSSEILSLFEKCIYNILDFYSFFHATSGIKSHSAPTH